MANGDTLSFDPSSLLPQTNSSVPPNFTLQDISKYLNLRGVPPPPSSTAQSPQQTDTTDNIGGAPGALQAGKGNRVDPTALYSYLRDQFAKSGVVNHAPADGERWGVNTGSAAEWAAFGLAVAKQESDLDTRSYNASDPGGSIGLFQFGEGQTRFTKGGNQFDPQQSANAFVRSVEQLVGQKGNIANLGATFGSIRRPNEAGQYIPFAQKIAAGASGKVASAAPSSSRIVSAPAPRDGNNSMVDLSRYLSFG